MGLYRRADSPFWWMALEARGRRAKRQSTQIPHDAPTAAQRLELKRQADEVYTRAQAKHVLEATGAAPKPAITVAQLLAWYGRHVAAQQKGAVRARSILKRLTADLGPIELSQLDRARIVEWRTARCEDVAPATADRELDVLKSALGQAVPKYLTSSPAFGLRRLKHRGTRRAVLSREDEAKLLAVLEPADQAIVIAALDTLVRAGDLLRLTWADDHGTHLTLLDSKSGDGYDVPISTRLRAALDALKTTVGSKKLEPRSYIFRHRRPKNGRSVELYRMIVDAGERAGLKTGRDGGLTFHGLRHTGTTRLIRAGVDLRTVQALGGWKSMRQLSRYAHPAAHLAAAVEHIGAGVPFTPDSREGEDDEKSA